MAWTDDQARAIELDNKNILVSAAAGSGKTAVLVERVVSHLLRPDSDSSHWDIDRLMVVTFTRAAAAEMSQRIQKALQEKINSELNKELPEKKDAALIKRLQRQLVLLSNASISTIDSFCQSIIKNNFSALDLDPRFRVASEQELHILQQDVLDELFEMKYAAGDKYLEYFSDVYGNENGDEALQKIILKVYFAAQNQSFPEIWLENIEKDYAGQRFERLEDTKWYPIIMEDVQDKLARMDDYLREMRELAENIGDEGPVQKFRGLLLEDKLVADNLYRALENGWDAMYAQLNGVTFSRMPGRMKGTVDPDVKEEYKAVREKFKKIVSALQTKNFDRSEADVQDDLRAISYDVESICTLVRDFSVAYAAAKKEKNLVDFSDMEHFALQLLRMPESTPDKLLPSPIALELRQRYQEIMVDEYQDTNGVQDDIVRLIAGEDNGNVFTVGDVKQSIYGFRSSDPGLFMAKYDDYQEKSNEAQELITLRQNFRSRKEVLSAVNYIFAQCMTRSAMEIEYNELAALYPGAEYGEPESGECLDNRCELDILIDEDSDNGDDLSENTGDRSGNSNTNTMAFSQSSAHSAIDKKYISRNNTAINTDEYIENGEAGEDEEDLTVFQKEAQFIANRLKALKYSGAMVFDKNEKNNNGYRPIRWKDMVILLRSASNKADVMLDILQKNDIPVYANAGCGFFQATEIQIMHSLLSIIDNARQDIHLAAVLHSPIVGFSMAELAQLRVSANAIARDADIYDVLLNTNSPDNMAPAQLKAKAAAFLEQLSSWRRLSRQVGVPELIWQLFRDTGYYDYVGGMPGGMLRQANLRMLVSRAQEYEKTDFRGLFRFLRFVDKLQEQEDLAMARTLGESEDVVRIMTIHKSKGLEFPVVVLANMNKNFNMQDIRMDRVQLHKDLGIGLERTEIDKAIRYPTIASIAVKQKLVEELKAEELRVLYVAMTRAREKLILTGTVKSGNLQSQAKKWCEGVYSSDKTLPEHMLREAANYFDWVCPAVAHHRDGKAIYDASGSAKAIEPIVTAMGEESRWKVDFVDMKSLRLPNSDDTEEDSLLAAVKAGQQLEVDNDTEAKVFSQLGWKYNFLHTENIPSKLSVTELKSRFSVERVDYSEADIAGGDDTPAAAYARPDDMGTRSVFELRPREETQLEVSKTEYSFKRPFFIRAVELALANKEKVAFENASEYITNRSISINPVSADIDNIAAAGGMEHNSQNDVARASSMEVTSPKASVMEKSVPIKDAYAYSKAQDSASGSQMTGTEYGTLMHAVMQKVNMHGDLSTRGIRNQLKQLVANGEFTAAQAKYVSPIKVADFFNSHIGQRLLHAKEVWRELPFSRMLQAQRFYPEVEDESAYIFSQGVIDLLFRDEQGKYILLDYKTDADTRQEIVVDKYQLQLELYTEAIEQITKIKVSERYLYMLHDGSLIKV